MATQTRLPNSDANTNWTSTGSPNYAQVVDSSDLTSIAADTDVGNAPEEYGLNAFSLGSVSSVSNLTITIRGKNNNQNNDIVLALSLNSVLAGSVTFPASSNALVNKTLSLNTNPSGGGAWSKAAIEALNDLLLQITSPDMADDLLTITEVSLVCTYTASAGGGTVKRTLLGVG